MNNTTPILMVTHTDLDGVAAYMVAAEYFFPENIVVRFADAGEEPVDRAVMQLMPFAARRGLHGEIPTLLITDQCPSNNMVSRLLEAVDRRECNLLILDHHKTAAERLLPALTSWGYSPTDPMHPERRIIINEQRCGAWLLHHEIPHSSEEYEDKRSIFNFVDAVDAWDTWKLGAPYRQDGVALNDLFKTLGRERFIKRGLRMRLSRDEEFLIEVSNERKARRAAEDMDNPMNFQQCTDAQGRLFAAAVSVSAPELLRTLAEARLPKATYLAAYNPLTNTVSLRDMHVSGVDVSEIARRFGGGGHKAAAGYRVDVPHISNILGQL